MKPSQHRYRGPRLPGGMVLPIGLAVFGCGYASGARYLVTSSPIRVGLGIRLCVALDLDDEKGVWWWGAGASGCSSRSTGPDVFRGEQARVSEPRGAQPGTAAFRVGTHSDARPYIDVKLLIEGRVLHAVETNDRVTLQDRNDLAIPEKPPRGTSARPLELVPVTGDNGFRTRSQSRR